MDLLETTVGKFRFRVPTDRAYSPEGLWVRDEGGGRARVGVTDYLQQHAGDVAFARVMPPGTQVEAGDELGSLETIKVDLVLPAPVGGAIVEANPALAAAPEVVNQDPYGGGWLAVVEVADRAAERLLDPAAYLAHMRRLAEEEVGAR